MWAGKHRQKTVGVKLGSSPYKSQKWRKLLVAAQLFLLLGTHANVSYVIIQMRQVHSKISSFTPLSHTEPCRRSRLDSFGTHIINF